MPTATVLLSSKGQVVIPKAIRDALNWESGTKLSLSANASGISLHALPKKPGNSLVDIVGFLRRDGKTGIQLSTEELCAPVDIETDLPCQVTRTNDCV